MDVVDGRAEAKFTFATAGNIRVNADYAPAEGTGQAAAKSTGTLVVTDGENAIATIDGPTEVIQGHTNTYNVSITPAEAGSVTISVDGHVVKKQLPLVDGKVAVDLTFPRSEKTDRKVKVAFTPEGKSAATATSELQVKAMPDVVQNVAVQFAPNSGVATAGEKTKVQVQVTPETTQAAKDVFGYVTLTNNGTPVTDEAGNEVKVPVAEGIADMDVTWLNPNPTVKNLEAKYFGLDGVEYGNATAVFTVTGGATEPAQVADTVVVGGKGVAELTQMDLTETDGNAGTDAGTADNNADSAPATGTEADTIAATAGSSMSTFWTSFLAFFQQLWDKFLALFGAKK